MITIITVLFFLASTAQHTVAANTIDESTNQVMLAGFFAHEGDLNEADAIGAREFIKSIGMLVQSQDRVAPFKIDILMPLHGKRELFEVAGQHMVSENSWYLWADSISTPGKYATIAVSGNSITASVYDGSGYLYARIFDAHSPGSRAGFVERREVVPIRCENTSHVPDEIVDNGIHSYPECIGSQSLSVAKVRRLYVFTEPVRIAAGDADSDGIPATKDDIDSVLMDVTARQNAVFVASGVSGVEIEFAGSWESTLSDDIAPTLDQLRDAQDGVLDEVHVFREIYQADIGMYLQQGDAGSPGGSAETIVSSASHWWARQSGVAAVLGSFVGAHETGHQFGAAHTRGSGASDPNVPYAYGHQTPNGYRTLMAWGGAQPQLYSSPSALDPIDGIYPLGISHDINPADSRDVVRAIEVAGTDFLQHYRTGMPNLSDCDNNGVPDLLDIFYGAADCNQNNILDSCEILSDPSLDCNSDGILDECQLDWRVTREQSEGRVPVSLPLYSPVFEFEDVYGIQSALTIEFEMMANYSDPNVVIEAFVNGQSYGAIFGGAVPAWQNNCPFGPMNYAQLVIPYGALPTPSVPDTVEVVLTATSGLSGCGSGRWTAVALEYLTISPADLNRDGVPDCLGEACSLADAAAPFGVLNYFDVAMFMNWFNSL